MTNKEVTTKKVVDYLEPSNCGNIGATAKEVGDHFGVTRSRAHQILQDLEDDEKVWSSKRGQARIWYPANFSTEVEDGKIIADGGFYIDSREGVYTTPTEQRAFPFDRISRVSFYTGATLVLTFLMWAQIAPSVGTDPSWWNPDIAEAALIGLVLMVAGVMMMWVDILLHFLMQVVPDRILDRVEGAL